MIRPLQKNILPMTLQLLIFNIYNILNMGFFNVVIILLLRKVHNIYKYSGPYLLFTNCFVNAKTLSLIQKHCAECATNSWRCKSCKKLCPTLLSQCKLISGHKTSYRNARWTFVQCDMKETGKEKLTVGRLTHVFLLTLIGLNGYYSYQSVPNQIV